MLQGLYLPATLSSNNWFPSSVQDPMVSIFPWIEILEIFWDLVRWLQANSGSCSPQNILDKKEERSRANLVIAMSEM
jgi:hypothetical protein